MLPQRYEKAPPAGGPAYVVMVHVSSPDGPPNVPQFVHEMPAVDFQISEERALIIQTGEGAGRVYAAGTWFWFTYRPFAAPGKE